MPRYVAFLRGVMPMNARMAELRAAFESAGFTNVKTVLASGNVVFDTARATKEATLQQKCEAAMQAHLGRSFDTSIRSVEHLQRLIAADPFARHAGPPGAKRVVTFLRKPPQPLPSLPIEHQQARILAIEGAEAFTAYVPQPNQPVFMALIEKTFGKDVTTRTWETVGKCASA